MQCFRHSFVPRRYLMKFAISKMSGITSTSQPQAARRGKMKHPMIVSEPSKRTKRNKNGSSLRLLLALTPVLHTRRARRHLLLSNQISTISPSGTHPQGPAPCQMQPNHQSSREKAVNGRGENGKAQSAVL